MNSKQLNSNEFDATSEWVVKAISGDIAAFEQLYYLYHKRIFLLAKRMTGSTGTAEEVVQDVFVKAWRKLESFRAESSFYTWIRSITTRLVIDGFRRKNAQLWQELTEYEELRHGQQSHDGDARDLEKLVALLPEGARNVFILHDIEGYKHTEIAEIAEIAVGTSKAQLSRARKLLREQLA